MNNELSKEDINELEKEIPLGKIGKPEDVAKCVKFFIDNEYVTGEIIKIDGRLEIKNR